jgi:hypothetical protein
MCGRVGGMVSAILGWRPHPMSKGNGLIASDVHTQEGESHPMSKRQTYPLSKAIFHYVHPLYKGSITVMLPLSKESAKKVSSGPRYVLEP